jgi:hypothetical protein
MMIDLEDGVREIFLDAQATVFEGARAAFQATTRFRAFQRSRPGGSAYVDLVCLFCYKPFERKRHKIDRRRSGRLFCSHACAGRYNGLARGGWATKRAGKWQKWREQARERQGKIVLDELISVD